MRPVVGLRPPPAPFILLFVAGILVSALLGATVQSGVNQVTKTAAIAALTPEPKRFRVDGGEIIDRTNGLPLFLRGVGYSPFLPGETPRYGASPEDDARYVEHFARFQVLGVNYIHVFPPRMPLGFFAELDKTDLVYGQDIWIPPNEADLLDADFFARTMEHITSVIDHTYAVGRPDRLLLFSVGDEISAWSVTQTDRRHPEVTDYRGKHLHVTGRTATEVALARLIDAAMDYELTHYGRRHLYCHTSWTHIGPVADRSDLEVSRSSVVLPDFGDLICLNVYTYARGVATSPPGSVTGTAYQGYLEDLAKLTAKPVLITQIGLSTSPTAPKPHAPGWGGHRINAVPEVLRGVWRDVRTAQGSERIAGMVLFSLHDEWWKFSGSAEDARYQHASDPEEWFGLYAIDKEKRLVPKGEIPNTVRSLFMQP